MKNKLVLFVSLFLVLILAVGIGCGKQTTPKTGTETPAPGPRGLCSDPICLQPYFLNCAPAELNIPFGAGATYTIIVFGLENGKCHWRGTVGDQTAVRGSDCYYPKEAMTTEALGHLFGQDKAPGQEKILQAQEKLNQENCTSI